MGEGKTNMFGKTYNTIGSTDSNFIIKTKGDLKVLWSGKFIDVIKNGKLASPSADILKTVASSDDISGNGIYLIPTGNEVWVSIDGIKVNISGEVGTTYVSFLAEQKEVTSDLKYTALVNAGLYYETLLEAEQAGIKAGIIYVVGENKLYLANNGKLTEYTFDNITSNSKGSFDELTVKDLTIYDEGPNMAISSPSLLFRIDELSAILLDLQFKSYLDLVMLQDTYILSLDATSRYGYRLYMMNGESTLEIDNVIVRDSLKVPTKYVEVRVEEFRKLIEEKKLIKNQLYRLYNFRNFWELGVDEILEEDATEENPANVRPLIVTGKNETEYYKDDCFFEEDRECIVSYDVTYDKQYTIPDGVAESLGLITKMRDPNGNECNYNFRHLKFWVDNTWINTFQGEGFYNNKLTLLNIKVESEVEINGEPTKITFEDKPNYATFISPCSDNTFKSQDVPLEIHEVFDNNTVYLNWGENVTYTSVINCIFKKDVKDTTITAELNSSTFESEVAGNKINAKITDSIFKGILLNSNINGEVTDSTFEKLVDNTIISDQAKVIDSTFEGIVQESNINSQVNDCVFEEMIWKSNINNPISNCTFLGKVEGSNINAELNGCLFKREVVNADIGSKLDGCTFEYELETTNLFNDSTLTFRNCLFLQRVFGDIEAPDNTIKNLLGDDEAKQIIFVKGKDGIKRIKVTLASVLTIPSGAIMMWYGKKDIPYGWVICDGTNDTPDLRGRFIKAASSSETIGELATDLNDNNELTLTREHLPEHSHPHQSHTHTVSGGSGDTTTGVTGPLALSTTVPTIKSMGTVNKNVITSVTGEGVTSQSSEIKVIDSMTSGVFTVTGGTHSHSMTSLDMSISSATSREESLSWTNKPIKIEPRAYALLFIMKL